MKNYSIKITAALIFTVMFAFASSAEAQGILGKIKQKVDKTTNDANKNDPTKTVNTNTGTTNTGSNSSTTSSAYSSSNTGNSALPPTAILKPTLRVLTMRDQHYWKQPNVDNYWSWVPRALFSITGPLTSNDIIVGEFTTPDGKPWFTAEEKQQSDLAAGQTREIELNKIIYAPNTIYDTRSSVATGTFGFKISVKNNLQGTAKELYKGTFKVNKFFAGTSNANFKNQYVFYVEQDWSLPIGYLWTDAKENANAPRLNASMWFRGENSTKINAYLYYNGKQIAATDNTSSGAVNRIVSNFSEGDDDEKAVWEHWQFTFFKVNSFNKGENANETHQLSRNPGSYEIKVLRDGELIRTANFTVGEDGRINDNNVAASNGFNGYRAVLPVKVVPTSAEKIDLQSWKTDAFYGNPLSGFSVQ